MQDKIHQVWHQSFYRIVQPCPTLCKSTVMHLGCSEISSVWWMVHIRQTETQISFYKARHFWLTPVDNSWLHLLEVIKSYIWLWFYVSRLYVSLRSVHIHFLAALYSETFWRSHSISFQKLIIYIPVHNSCKILCRYLSGTHIGVFDVFCP